MFVVFLIPAADSQEEGHTPRVASFGPSVRPVPFLSQSDQIWHDEPSERCDSFCGGRKPAPAPEVVCIKGCSVENKCALVYVFQIKPNHIYYIPFWQPRGRISNTLTLDTQSYKIQNIKYADKGLNIKNTSATAPESYWIHQQITVFFLLQNNCCWSCVG